MEIKLDRNQISVIAGELLRISNKLLLIEEYLYKCIQDVDLTDEKMGDYILLSETLRTEIRESANLLRENYCFICNVDEEFKSIESRLKIRRKKINVTLIERR